MKMKMAVAAVVAAVSAAAPVSAQGIGLWVNGRPVNMGGQPPRVVNGHLLVPLAAIGDPLGAILEWRPAVRVVYGRMNGHNFALPIGSRTATVDGQTQTLEAPATLVLGRTLVPLRFVATALGANVRYENATRTVYVNNRRNVANEAAPPIVPVRPVPRRAPRTRTNDNRAPVITGLTPKDEADVAGPRVVVRASFQDRGGSGIALGSAQLLINGLDVTDRSVVSGNSIVYRGRITPGPVEARVAVEDQAGNRATEVWTFNVSGP